MALGSIQPPAEMSPSSISKGWGNVGRCVWLKTLPPICTLCLEILFSFWYISWHIPSPNEVPVCDTFGAYVLVYFEESVLSAFPCSNISALTYEIFFCTVYFRNILPNCLVLALKRIDVIETENLYFHCLFPSLSHLTP